MTLETITTQEDIAAFWNWFLECRDDLAALIEGTVTDAHSVALQRELQHELDRRCGGRCPLRTQTPAVATPIASSRVSLSARSRGARLADIRTLSGRTVMIATRFHAPSAVRGSMRCSPRFGDVTLWQLGELLASRGQTRGIDRDLCRGDDREHGSHTDRNK